MNTSGGTMHRKKKKKGFNISKQKLEDLARAMGKLMDSMPFDRSACNGNKSCGWDSCDLDIIAKIDRERGADIPAEYANVGIPSPIDILDNDLIRLCGIAWVEDNDSSSDHFGAALEFFNCSDLTDGEFPAAQVLVYGETNYDNDNVVCFSFSYEANGQEGISRCDSHFVVGLRSYLQTASQVKFTYTLNVSRSCSQG